jgi:hypothetical protein
MTRQKHRPQARLLIGRTSPGLTLIDNTDLPLLPVGGGGGGGACHERRAWCQSEIELTSQTLIDNTDLPLLHVVVVVGGGGACHERVHGVSRVTERRHRKGDQTWRM